MFAKGRSFLLAQIEEQAIIIERMIVEFSELFSENQKKIEKQISTFAKENSDGDLDVYDNIMEYNKINLRLDDNIDILNSFYKSSLFLVYSYFELNLKEIVQFYNVSIFENPKKQKPIIDLYMKAIEKKIGKKVLTAQTRKNIETIRILRNFLIHDTLDKKRIIKLKERIGSIVGITYNNSIEIQSDKYIIDSLIEIKKLLIEILSKIEKYEKSIATKI